MKQVRVGILSDLKWLFGHSLKVSGHYFHFWLIYRHLQCLDNLSSWGGGGLVVVVFSEVKDQQGLIKMLTKMQLQQGWVFY